MQFGKTLVGGIIGAALGIGLLIAVYLMFGIDNEPLRLPKSAARHIMMDKSILGEVIGVSEAQLDLYFWGACEKFMGA